MWLNTGGRVVLYSWILVVEWCYTAEYATSMPESIPWFSSLALFKGHPPSPSLATRIASSSVQCASFSCLWCSQFWRQNGTNRYVSNGTHIKNWSMQRMNRRWIYSKILCILYMISFKSCILWIKHVSYILYSYLSTQLWNPCALCAITSILLKMNAGGDDKKRELM